MEQNQRITQREEYWLGYLERSMTWPKERAFMAQVNSWTSIFMIKYQMVWHLSYVSWILNLSITIYRRSLFSFCWPGCFKSVGHMRNICSVKRLWWSLRSHTVWIKWSERMGPTNLRKIYLGREVIETRWKTNDLLWWWRYWWRTRKKTQKNSRRKSKAEKAFKWPKVNKRGSKLIK